MDSDKYVLIRPQLSKEEFLETVLQKIQETIKEDAVDNLESLKFSLKYLVGYQFKGKADCSYSCQIGNDIDITINNKKSKINQGTPILGDLNDYAFNIAIPSVESIDIPWVKAVMGKKVYDVIENTIAVSDLNTIKEEILGENISNPLDYWVKNSNDLLDNVFLEPIEAIASNSAVIYEKLGIIDANAAAQMVSMGITTTVNIMNLSLKTRNNLQEYGQKVLIPFYVLEFSYNNKDYFIFSNAGNNPSAWIKIPIGVTNTPEEQAQIEMPDKFKRQKIVNWAWIISVIALFTIGFNAAVVCLAVWGIAKWYFKRDINTCIKAIEENRTKTQKRINQKLSQKFSKL